ncbi:hypothetical protein EJB05_18574 [Eragrostis curvula]|uniref:DUF6598 domain-containing protein n=1 Tax=Eragrostis curvula TaxID=38414 RepID=A0A5J9VKH3_9POAL|nr:hypothetical protein EJB05_18574 [Eragrostis curvula]
MEKDQAETGAPAPCKTNMQSKRKPKKMREALKQEEQEITRFRRFWEDCYGDFFGSFDDTTVVPPMNYTFGLASVPKYAIPDNTLQIFSVKVTQLIEEEGLRWPLHVFGLIAIRDSIDPRRNILFHRERDHCQTITEEEPFLLLTGPSRAPVLIDPVRIEVQLKAKGKSVLKDKGLIFDVLTTMPACSYPHHPRMFTCDLDGIRGNLEFTLAVLQRSVEATIRVKVVDGRWHGGMSARVSAHTASIDHGDIVLLDSGDGLVPNNTSGIIQLSRRVVSVELSGELNVVVEAKCLNRVIKKLATFNPKMAGSSYATLKFSFCALGITVAWSQFSRLVPGQPGPAVYH